MFSPAGIALPVQEGEFHRQRAKQGRPKKIDKIKRKGISVHEETFNVFTNFIADVGCKGFDDGVRLLLMNYDDKYASILCSEGTSQPSSVYNIISLQPRVVQPPKKKRFVYSSPDVNFRDEETGFPGCAFASATVKVEPGTIGAVNVSEKETVTDVEPNDLEEEEMVPGSSNTGSLSKEMLIVDDTRWIVDETKLIRLLGTKCRRPDCTDLIDESTVTVSSSGCVAIITWNCRSSHFGKWASSTLQVHDTNKKSKWYANNVLLAGAIFLSDVVLTKIEKLFKVLIMNLQMFKSKVYYDLQRNICNYLVPEEGKKECDNIPYRLALALRKRAEIFSIYTSASKMEQDLKNSQTS